MTTPPISTELKAYLSCIYFDSLFFEPPEPYLNNHAIAIQRINNHAIALQGNLSTYAKEIYPLVNELMKKHPEWIDYKILINSSYVKINGRNCDYCRYKNIIEKICEFLEKQNVVVDWNYYIVNTETFTPISIKVDTDNQHLLMLMLNQLNKTTEKETSIPNQPVDLLNFSVDPK